MHWLLALGAIAFQHDLCQAEATAIVCLSSLQNCSMVSCRRNTLGSALLCTTSTDKAENRSEDIRHEPEDRHGDRRTDTQSDRRPDKTPDKDSPTDRHTSRQESHAEQRHQHSRSADSRHNPRQQAGAGRQPVVNPNSKQAELLAFAASDMNAFSNDGSFMEKFAASQANSARQRSHGGPGNKDLTLSGLSLNQRAKLVLRQSHVCVCVTCKHNPTFLQGT